MKLTNTTVNHSVGASDRIEGTIVVAGHLCLDVVPEMSQSTASNSQQMFAGGQLTEIGPVALLPGGVVANTGRALQILGIDTILMGKVGNDRFGHLVGDILRAGPTSQSGAVLRDPVLAFDSSASTSYTVVLTPPDIDRVYLHCPGANDTFLADDIDYEIVSNADIFHFGYPPLMARMFEDEGQELVRVFDLARRTSVVTSLDMAMPDPGAPAGKAPWRKILQNALPHVDVFLPSAEEAVRMLHPEWKRQTTASPSCSGFALDQIRDLAAELVEMGARVVVLKLGSDGIYVRTGLSETLESLPPRLARVASDFGSRELLSGCYAANVLNAVGAGDSTVAGFLAGLLKGLPLSACTNSALAVGAKSVEGLHTTSGIPSWETIANHIEGGWQKPTHLGSSLTNPGPDWRYRADADLFELNQ